MASSRKQVEELLDMGKAQAVVAAELGVTRQWVNYVAHHQRKYNRVGTDGILALHDQGLSVRAIAEATDYGSGYVRHVLWKDGRSAHRRPRRRECERDHEWIAHRSPLCPLCTVNPTPTPEDQP